MILGYCSIAYVDQVVPLSEWGAMKSSGKLPPGAGGSVQLPILELEDGTMMPESLDIAKHIWTKIAKKPVTGSDPENLWRLNDKTDGPFNSPDFPRPGMVNPYLNFFDEEEAAPKIGPLVAGFPAFFEHLAPLLAEAPGPFFGGAEPNYGDFQMFHVTDNLTTLDGGASLGALEGTQPALFAWYKAMEALPAVAAYLASRPQPGSGEVGKPGTIIFKYKQAFRR